MMTNVNPVAAPCFLFPDMTLPFAAIQRGNIGTGENPCALILLHDQAQAASGLPIKPGQRIVDIRFIGRVGEGFDNLHGL